MSQPIVEDEATKSVSDSQVATKVESVGGAMDLDAEHASEDSAALQTSSASASSLAKPAVPKDASLADLKDKDRVVSTTTETSSATHSFDEDRDRYKQSRTFASPSSIQTRKRSRSGSQSAEDERRLQGNVTQEQSQLYQSPSPLRQSDRQRRQQTQQQQEPHNTPQNNPRLPTSETALPSLRSLIYDDAQESHTRSPSMGIGSQNVRSGPVSRASSARSTTTPGETSAGTSADPMSGGIGGILGGSPDVNKLPGPSAVFGSSRSGAFLSPLAASNAPASPILTAQSTLVPSTVKVEGRETSFAPNADRQLTRTEITGMRLTTYEHENLEALFDISRGLTDMVLAIGRFGELPSSSEWQAAEAMTGSIVRHMDILRQIFGSSRQRLQDQSVPAGPNASSLESSEGRFSQSVGLAATRSSSAPRTMEPGRETDGQYRGFRSSANPHIPPPPFVARPEGDQISTAAPPARATVVTPSALTAAAQVPPALPSTRTQLFPMMNPQPSGRDASPMPELRRQQGTARPPHARSSSWQNFHQGQQQSDYSRLIRAGPTRDDVSRHVPRAAYDLGFDPRAPGLDVSSRNTDSNLPSRPLQPAGMPAGTPTRGPYSTSPLRPHRPAAPIRHASEHGHGHRHLNQSDSYFSAMPGGSSSSTRQATGLAVTSPYAFPPPPPPSSVSSSSRYLHQISPPIASPRGNAIAGPSQQHPQTPLGGEQHSSSGSSGASGLALESEEYDSSLSSHHHHHHRMGPTKYRKRSRAPGPSNCLSCGAGDTPEWRRGPDGARTLCNACGLHYSKLVRRKRIEEGNPSANVSIEELRMSLRLPMLN